MHYDDLEAPSEIIIEKIKKIPANIKATFISAMLLGLFAHLYHFTNKQWNYDELVETPGGYGTGIPSGRWCLEFLGELIGKITDNYSLPLYTGILSLLLLSFCACIIVKILGITDLFSCLFIGGICTTFPAIISTFFFLFTAGYYSLAIFMSILAIYLVSKGPQKPLPYIGAVILVACSVGIYQAYFAISVCMALLSLIRMVFCIEKDQKKYLKNMIRQGIKYFLTLCAGLILYFLINRIVISITQVSLNEYQGINHMGHIDLKALPSLLKKCYLDFVKLHYSDLYHLLPTVIAKTGFIFLEVLSLFAVLKFVISRRSAVWANMVMLFLLCALLPIGCFLIYIMAPEGDVYELMLYNVAIIYFVPITIIENVREKNSSFILRKLWMHLRWIGGMFMLLILLSNIWFANANYAAMTYTNIHDLMYAEIITTQIKSTKGYSDDLPVAFIGETIEDKTLDPHPVAGVSMEKAALGGRSYSNINAYSRMRLFFSYIGFNPTIVWNKTELQELSQRKEILEMPVYPKEGSIKIVNGTIIIKLSEKAQPES